MFKTIYFSLVGFVSLYLLNNTSLIARRKFFKYVIIYSLLGSAVFSVGSGILAHYLFGVSLDTMSVVDKSIWIDTFFALMAALNLLHSCFIGQ